MLCFEYKQEWTYFLHLLRYFSVSWRLSSLKFGENNRWTILGECHPKKTSFLDFFMLPRLRVTMEWPLRAPHLCACLCSGLQSHFFQSICHPGKVGMCFHFTNEETEAEERQAKALAKMRSVWFQKLELFLQWEPNLLFLWSHRLCEGFDKKRSSSCLLETGIKERDCIKFCFRNNHWLLTK